LELLCLQGSYCIAEIAPHAVVHAHLAFFQKAVL
jgi:hypothetical protein